jgi:hypothetical protein
MKLRVFICPAIAIMFLVFASLVHAAGWQLKDMGVGLYVYDQARYDRDLQIIEKRNTWSLKELQEKNAFSQASRTVFGAWLVGPPADTFKDPYGLDKYLYKYRLIDPKGNATVFGPHSFYKPGFAAIGINAWTFGKWKIEFMLWHRSTQNVTPIGSIEFIITDEAKAKPAPADWQLKDMGVGIYDDAAYDTELRIVEKRNTWSMKELQSRGALTGRGKVFGAWLIGPPVKTYLNENGVARYLYKYRLTDPKGKSMVFGPHGFYQPGFATMFINTWIAGDWKIEFMIWSRSTGQESPVGAIDFKITD